MCWPFGCAVRWGINASVALVVDRRLLMPASVLALMSVGRCCITVVRRSWRSAALLQAKEVGCNCARVCNWQKCVWCMLPRGRHAGVGGRDGTGGRETSTSMGREVALDKGSHRQVNGNRKVTGQAEPPGPIYICPSTTWKVMSSRVYGFRGLI